MMSEGFGNFIARETGWIIIDEKTYKEPAPKSLDELRQ